MRKNLLINLLISFFSTLFLLSGINAQVKVQGYPNEDFKDVRDALFWIKGQSDITEAVVEVPEGDILTTAGFGNFPRAVKITVQGSGADKSIIRGYADTEDMPNPGEGGRRFLQLNDAKNDGSEFIFQDLTFLRWGFGDGNGGAVVNIVARDINLSFINCNFEDIRAEKGAITQSSHAENTVTFDNCFIGGGSSLDRGAINGMIYKNGGNLIITNTTFMSNIRKSATSGDEINEDRGTRRAGVISLESSAAPLNFVLAECMFINNKTHPEGSDEVQPMISFFPTQQMDVTMEGNIMLGNLREGKEKDADIYINNPAPIQWSNGGNIMNRAVQRDGDNVVAAEIPECDISMEWTYDHEEIGFVMAGDLPKVLVDEFGVKYVGFEDPNSVFSKDQDAKVSVYPNPSSGIFNVLIPENLRNARYEVYNTIGKLIKTGVIANNNEIINLSDSHRGMYILKITNNEEVYIRNLIVK